MRIRLEQLRTYRTATLAMAFVLAMSSLVAPLTAGNAVAQDDPLATRVQVLHAGVDTGKIEVHFNGDKVLDEFEYSDQSDWLDIDAGTLRVTITEDRRGFNYAIFDSVYPAPAGNDYYIIVTDALVLAGVLDESSLPDGQGRVQLVHASINTPPVDVGVSGNGVDASVSLSYAGKTEAVDAPAGSYAVDVSLTDGGDSLLSVPDFAVEAGTSSVVAAIGDPGDSDHPLELVVIQSGTSSGSDSATPEAEATPVS